FVDALAAELALEAGDRFGDAAVVKVDAILRGMRDRQPVARLEMALRRPGAIAKQGVVMIEALERRLRDGSRVRNGGHVDRTRACGMQRSRRRHAFNAETRSLLYFSAARDAVLPRA